MGSRKRTNPNLKAEASQPSQFPPPEAVPLPKERSRVEHLKNNGSQEPPSESIATPGSSVAEAPSLNSEAETPKSTKAWYGGTWPRAPKAAPITRIAKDGISTATGVISSVAEAATSPEQNKLALAAPKSPSVYLSRTLGSSTRSLPLSTTTTKLNISSSGLKSTLGLAGSSARTTDDDQGTDRNVEALQPDNGKDVEKISDGAAETAEKDMPPPNDTAVAQNANSSPARQAPEGQSSWLGWFSQTERFANKGLPNVEGSSEGNKAPFPTLDLDAVNSQRGNGQKLEQRRNSDPSPRTAIDEEGKQHPRSWLGFWSNPTPPPEKNTSKPLASPSTPALSTVLRKEPTSAGPVDRSTAITANSGGWAFWSRSNANESNNDGRPPSLVGELAVAGSASQSKPENAVIDNKKAVPKTGVPASKPQKRLSSAANGEAKQRTKEAKISGPTIVAAEPALSKSTKVKETKSVLNQKSDPENLVLPSFEKTFRVADSPGFLQQLGNLLYRKARADPKHVNILRDPPRIKKALAIGVHGYFPAPLIRSVLGQPTGTSIRFAESAASAIQKWTSIHGYSCEVEKVALEGEGKIEERIDVLWKLMLNWLEDIRKADFILVACHSQGVPVAIMLVAKLIAFGCVNGARIGVCAMAGVNIGPFADYKSRWISGSAGELFEFAQANSKVSKDYKAALDTTLQFGVKILYIGSIDDQLVSLEVRIAPTAYQCKVTNSEFSSRRRSASLIIHTYSGLCSSMEEFMPQTCKLSVRPGA